MLISNLQAASLYAANAHGKSNSGNEEAREGLLREAFVRERPSTAGRQKTLPVRPDRPLPAKAPTESAPVSISPAARLAAEAEAQARQQTAKTGSGESGMSYAQQVAANYRELLQKHGMVDTQAHYQKMLSEGADSEAERQAFIAQAKADARLMTLLPGVGRSGRY